MLLLLYSLYKYIAHFANVFFCLSSFCLSFSVKCLCLKFKFFFSSDFCSKKLYFLKERTRTHSFDINSRFSLCLSLSSPSSVVCCCFILVFCRSFFKREREETRCLLRSLVNDGVGGIQRE